MSNSDIRINRLKFDKEDFLLKENLILFLQKYPFEEDLKKEVNSHSEYWALRYLDYIEELIEFGVFGDTVSFAKLLSVVVSNDTTRHLIDFDQNIITPEELKENYPLLKAKAINFLENHPYDKDLKECIDGEYEYWAEKYLSHIKKFTDPDSNDEYIKNPYYLEEISWWIGLHSEIKLKKFQKNKSSFKEDVIEILKTASYDDALRKHINEEYEYWAERYFKEIETIMEYDDPRIELSDMSPKGILQYIEIDLACQERMGGPLHAELVGFDPDFAPGGKKYHDNLTQDCSLDT